jgi:hypothetical protein
LGGNIAWGAGNGEMEVRPGSFQLAPNASKKTWNLKSITSDLGEKKSIAE